MSKSVQMSVKDLDWVGWNKMKELVEEAEGKSKGSILVGFKTGGRISEILPLKKTVFRSMGSSGR